MKKFFRPLTESLETVYERQKHHKMPRAKGKRVRRYAQVDIQREFEIRNAEREKRKKAALNRIYSEYDKKALEMRELVTVDGEESELQKKTKEELIIEM